MVAFTAGAVLTAANLNTAFNALTIRAVTGTSDTFLLADNGGAVSYSNASSITATIPPNSSVAFATGTTIQLLNLGAGVVTVTAGVGVTLNGSSVAIAQNAGGTLIKTATNTWYFLPSATAPGMELITPTSVAGTGVTLSGGEVTFSAATEVDVNGCFTSAYDSYALVITATASATVFNSFRMRLAGSNAVGASDYTYGLFFVNGTPNSGALTNSTGASAGSIGYIGTERSVHNLTIAQPALATFTAITGLGLYTLNSSTTQTIGTTHRLNTAYDGFAIIPASGNITGKLRIYGLRNS